MGLLLIKINKTPSIAMAGFDQSIIFLSKSRYKLHKIREEFLPFKFEDLTKMNMY